MGPDSPASSPAPPAARLDVIRAQIKLNPVHAEVWPRPPGPGKALQPPPPACKTLWSLGSPPNGRPTLSLQEPISFLLWEGPRPSGKPGIVGGHEAGRRTDSRVGHRERHAVSVSTSPGDPSHGEQPSRSWAGWLPFFQTAGQKPRDSGPRCPCSVSGGLVHTTGPFRGQPWRQDPPPPPSHPGTHRRCRGCAPHRRCHSAEDPGPCPPGCRPPSLPPGASPTHLPGVLRPAQVGRSTGVVTGSRAHPTCFTASVCPPV